MGVGAASVMPATLSILNAVLPRGERAQAIAAWSAVAGIGIVIGPTLGGALLSHFAWGSIFLVNLPLVAVALVGVCWVVPETAEPGEPAARPHWHRDVGTRPLPPRRRHHRGAECGWTAPLTLAEGAAAILLLVGFGFVELRRESPLIDMRIFANRAFSAAAASVTFTFFALFGSLFVLTQYLQLVHGYSPLSAGVRALPFAATMGACSPLSAVLARRFGARPVISGGLG